MGIIPCSEECHFQSDGYCQLEKYSTVSCINESCPYYMPRSKSEANNSSSFNG